MAYIILYLLLFHVILALIAKVLPEANRGSITEESTQSLGALLLLVCALFVFIFLSTNMTAAVWKYLHSYSEGRKPDTTPTSSV